jgi:DNA polymerase III epsilon subunit-like protein
MTQVMVDLETMGTGSNSAITAIGAVQFDSKGLGKEFYVNVDLKSSVRCGMEINPDTVMWWLGQSDEARDALGKDAVPLFKALKDFATFVGAKKEAKVWGCGSDFDNVILANAYDLNNLDRPWHFYNNMCYRTVKNLIGGTIKIKRIGEHHNALDDAKSQAEHLVRMLAALGGE